jgi:hypothetical protein
MTSEVPAQEAPQPQATETSFLDALPEDIRAEPSLQSIKDITSLAKSYVSAQRMIGGSIRIPSQEAGKEQVDEFMKKLESVPGVTRIPDFSDKAAADAFFNKLGRPESPDKYEIKLDPKLSPSQEQLQTFLQEAHKAGLNRQQVQTIMDFESKRTLHSMEQFEKQKAGAQEALKQVWGNDYKNKMEGAKLVLSQYAEKFPDAVKDLVNSSAGNNPVILSALAQLGQMMVEKGSLVGAKAPVYGLTPEEARSQISDIRNNKQHPVNNARAPGHREAVAKLERLYQAAYPQPEEEG